MAKTKKIYELSPEAKLRKQTYIAKYGKEHYTVMSFKLRTKEDAELINKIKGSNKSTCSLVKEALLYYFGK